MSDHFDAEQFIRDRRAGVAQLTAAYGYNPAEALDSCGVGLVRRQPRDQPQSPARGQPLLRERSRIVAAHPGIVLPQPGRILPPPTRPAQLVQQDVVLTVQ